MRLLILQSNGTKRVSIICGRGVSTLQGVSVLKPMEIHSGHLKLSVVLRVSVK